MLPVQITAKDIPVTPVLEAHIRKRVDKLKHYYDHINSCRVVITLPKQHMHQGKIYNVHLDLKVTGKELVVTRKSNEDMYVAIRDAFDALERQLEEHGRKRHGRVKTHDAVTRGRVERIMTEDGFGFIEDNDGNEYYFSVTNVSYPSFSLLIAGDAVEFIAVPFNDGMQAHRITKIAEG